jgi:hypothetical protein
VDEAVLKPCVPKSIVLGVTMMHGVATVTFAETDPLSAANAPVPGIAQSAATMAATPRRLDLI